MKSEEGFSRVTMGLFVAGRVEGQSSVGILYKQPDKVVRSSRNTIFFKVTPEY